MSTITREFTKEQLIEVAQEIVNAWVEITERESDSSYYGIRFHLAKIALASLEAKPIGAFHIADQQVDGTTDYIKDGDWPIDDGVIEVYAATPVPGLSFDIDTYREILERISDERDEEIDAGQFGGSNWVALVEAAYDACRAAMLQGAEPVTTAYKLPANTPCKEAPEHIWLQTAGVWPENGEFSELTWCSDNQHEDDTLYVRADVVAGNSPVIPDGWVMVPKEPTEEMIAAAMNSNDVLFDKEDDTLFRVQHGEIWRAMLSAAPQREVKNG